MRWRSEKEVISGKGQFSCGARGCNELRGLATYEVPFGYEEAGQKKQALVKVQTPPAHVDLVEWSILYGFSEGDRVADAA